MTVGYFDSSALVKLLLGEDGWEVSRAVWTAVDTPATSRVAYPEVRAALAAAHRGRRLTARQYTAVRADWERRWSQLRVIEAEPRVASRAGDLAEECALRGFDAVHLASALLLGDAGDPDAPIMVAWDARLREAAVDLGLRTAPGNAGAGAGA